MHEVGLDLTSVTGTFSNNVSPSKNTVQVLISFNTFNNSLGIELCECYLVIVRQGVIKWSFKVTKARSAGYLVRRPPGIIGSTF